MQHHHWLVEHLGDAQHVLRRLYDPRHPSLGALEFSALFQEHLVAGAVEENTLTDAFAYASFWIAAATHQSDQQFHANTNNAPYLIRFNSCREVMKAVLDEWIARSKSLAEFQPCFTPPPPPHG